MLILRYTYHEPKGLKFRVWEHECDSLRDVGDLMAEEDRGLRCLLTGEDGATYVRVRFPTKTVEIRRLPDKTSH